MPLYRRRNAPEHEALRVFYQLRDENPWLSSSARLNFTPHRVRAGRAAPAARSWVGWVRVVGTADVIDALDAWQKHPFRRIPSPGQHRSGSFGSRSEQCPARFEQLRQPPDPGLDQPVLDRAIAEHERTP